ncbi:uncharacterized protein LOC143134128 [Alosa pseudoharengus]|uniref:uncharacterized protein LOC143134128 n=1 Tax=Alosa pseudoharengus TaxID=34774 RepID=UPI003F88780A
MAMKQAVLFMFWYVGTRMLSRLRVEEISPGDNIILYCDCPQNEKTKIVWFRESLISHQPLLILTTVTDSAFKPVPRYNPFWNSSSKSYDLMIKNVSESDLGLYYCVTMDTTDKLAVGAHMTSICLSNHSIVTSPGSHPTPPPSSNPPPDGGQCWSLLVIWCSVCILLSALISSTCVYCHFNKAGRQQLESQSDNNTSQSRSTKQDEDKDVCYAALEIPTKERRQRPKKKRAENPDLCTYSEVRAYQSQRE